MNRNGTKTVPIVNLMWAWAMVQSPGFVKINNNKRAPPVFHVSKEIVDEVMAGGTRSSRKLAR